MVKIDPTAPFATKTVLDEIVGRLKNFNFKLYGKIPIKFYKGKPTKYEFDLELGAVHFTEQDFKGLSKIFSEMNKKWKTAMTFCIYTAKEKRAMVINVRGSSKAPFDMD